MLVYQSLKFSFFASQNTYGPRPIRVGGPDGDFFHPNIKDPSVFLHPSLRKNVLTTTCAPIIMRDLSFAVISDVLDSWEALRRTPDYETVAGKFLFERYVGPLSLWSWMTRRMVNPKKARTYELLTHLLRSLDSSKHIQMPCPCLAFRKLWTFRKCWGANAFKCTVSI